MKFCTLTFPLCLAFWLLIPFFSLTAAEIGEESRTYQLRQHLLHLRGEIDSLMTRRGDLYNQLNKIDEELELSSRLLQQYRKERREVEEEIGKARNLLAQSKASFAVERRQFAHELSRLYVFYQDQGSKRWVDPDWFLKVKATENLGEQMIRRKKADLFQIDTQISDYQSSLTFLASKEKELEKLIAMQKGEEDAKKEALRQREKVVATVQGEERFKIRQKRELEKSSQLLGEIIESLVDSTDRQDDPVWQKERELIFRMKGKLFWPVSGKLVANFGMKREQTTGITTKNTGIKIKAKPGTKVVAALTGEVIYIGWARGLENFIVVDHGGSVYSLYGNLDELNIKEGDQIIRGESFATLAEDKLHFEVRDGKVAVNPTEWLKH